MALTSFTIVINFVFQFDSLLLKTNSQQCIFFCILGEHQLIIRGTILGVSSIKPKKILSLPKVIFISLIFSRNNDSPKVAQHQDKSFNPNIFKSLFLWIKLFLNIQMMQEIENYPTALINLNSKLILVTTYLGNFVFLNLFPKTK